MYFVVKSTGQGMACLPGVFGAAGVLLHHLCHKAAHGLRCLVLHLPGGMSVGAQGEACVVMAQHTGDRLDVHAILQSEGGESVPLWHNKDKSDNPCGATG